MSDRGIVERALGSLGKGFDITSDFRLKYCKGEERLVLLNEKETRELNVPGFGGVKGVSVDIKCDKGDRIRYQSDILDFNHVITLLRSPSIFVASCFRPNFINSIENYFVVSFTRSAYADSDT
ncbi:hypothetical protein C3L33_13249, partial [Rhododendron williamsianum]